jgi:hypothetical protein
MSKKKKTRSLRLDFDSVLLITIPVTIAGQEYELREASGDASAKYRNAMLACSTLGPDGKPIRMEGLADVDFFLLSLCLFDKATNVLVTEDVIRSWPNRMCETLIDELKEISGMSEDDEEAAKNLPSGTPTGSD